MHFKPIGARRLPSFHPAIQQAHIGLRTLRQILPHQRRCHRRCRRKPSHIQPCGIAPLFTRTREVRPMHVQRSSLDRSVRSFSSPTAAETEAQTFADSRDSTEASAWAPSQRRVMRVSAGLLHSYGPCVFLLRGPSGSKRLRSSWIRAAMMRTTLTCSRTGKLSRVCEELHKQISFDVRGL
jgi:hypothetical protein